MDFDDARTAQFFWQRDNNVNSAAQSKRASVKKNNPRSLMFFADAATVCCPAVTVAEDSKRIPCLLRRLTNLNSATMLSPF